MEEQALAVELGGLIRRLRLERGYSQAGFAEACKIERAYMGMIERGEVNVSVRTAYKLARGLDLPLSGLFLELERHTDGPEEG
jgi:transcriptional regulator with XRE-family HTH domain